MPKGKYKNIELLSEYLHDLGDILYYKSDPILKNIVILNPEWITKACYDLIDDYKIQENYGKFSYNDLEHIWDQQVYPKEKHYEIIRLIERFEFSFNLIGSFSYIIPELLKSNSTYDESLVVFKSKLKFEYRFKFMPSGVLASFICRNHSYIERDYFWKNGVVLNFEDSTALVKGDYLNRKIKIYVTGEDCESLLGIVHRDLDEILSSLNFYKDKDYYEFIPCNCSSCSDSPQPYFYEFSVVKRFRKKNKLTSDCQKSTDTVKINSLIKGYDKIRPGESVLAHLITAFSQLQGQNKLYKSNENSRNEVVATALTNRGLIAKDQALWGSYPSNKSQGEIDIKIENEAGLTISLFEGLNLRYADTIAIQSHIEKIFSYDPNGLEDNFIGVYSEASDFIDLWLKYQKIVVNSKTKYLLVGDFLYISDNYSFGSNFRVGRTIYSSNGQHISIYHLFLNMNV